MNAWRMGLLGLVLVSTAFAWSQLYRLSNIRSSLLLLVFVFALGSVVVVAMQRKQPLRFRRVTAHLALGSIVHLFLAGLLELGERIERSSVGYALESHWRYLLVGAGGILAALFAWSYSTRPLANERAPNEESLEPAPQEGATEVDWELHLSSLEGDSPRIKQLQALKRIHSLANEPAIKKVIAQEANRIVHDAERQDKAQNENDVLTKAAEFLEWGVAKIPELPQMDFSDLLMAKAVADIHAQHSSVEHIFVDHRTLLPIHPITRGPAIQKCEERAASVKEALPLLKENGLRLSEEFIASTPALSSFDSVTGFQVVSLDEGYVTFEGNGRREALAMALPEDEGVLIEVRHFRFDDESKKREMQRRVKRVRQYKGVA